MISYKILSNSQVMKKDFKNEYMRKMITLKKDQGNEVTDRQCMKSI